MGIPAAAPGAFDEEAAEPGLWPVFLLLDGLDAKISSRRGKEVILIPLEDEQSVVIGRHAPYWPQESWTYEVIYLRPGPPPLERTLGRLDDPRLAACVAREAARLTRKPGHDDG